MDTFESIPYLDEIEYDELKAVSRKLNSSGITKILIKGKNKHSLVVSFYDAISDLDKKRLSELPSEVQYYYNKIDNLSHKYEELDRLACNPHDSNIICPCNRIFQCKSDKFKYFTRLPNFVIDICMEKLISGELSRTAFILYVFLFKNSDFNPKSNNFGRCRFTHKQILEATGISMHSMRKYINQLEDNNFITYNYTLKCGDSNRPTTLHHYTVRYFKIRKNAIK
ncbi:hypothetical protein ACFL2E_03025 [Thermodesulfobacteriota bacterium]